MSTIKPGGEPSRGAGGTSFGRKSDSVRANPGKPNRGERSWNGRFCGKFYNRRVERARSLLGRRQTVNEPAHGGMLKEIDQNGV